MITVVFRYRIDPSSQPAVPTTTVPTPAAGGSVAPSVSTTASSTTATVSSASGSRVSTKM